VAAREQTGDSELNCLILAYNDFTNLLCEGVNVVGHSEMICGNDALRKRDILEMAFAFLFLLMLQRWI
jgi:hypothetical protein